MPGSIHISATQPPATPLFLQVAVGKKEYSGNIEQDGLSFPVTSLRESILIMLYNVDRELISKTELDTKTIVESGTRDVVFRLGSGGEVILQMQFLLSDADRRRIQEMRSSVLKRKQQELPGDGLELNLPDSTLTKRLIEKISNIENKRDQTYLQKSLLPDDLPDRAILSGINMDPGTRASRDLLLQNDGRKSEDPNASRKGHGNGEPESRSSSAVKKMISAFESTSSQGILRSETGASLTLSSGTGRKDREADEAIVPLVGAKDSSYRSRKQALLLENQGQDESRSHRLNGHDGVSKLEVREHELMSRGKLEVKKHRRSKSMGPFSLEQLHSMGSLSKCYLERPLNYLVAASSTWLHPHVCVTTASRELKGLLEVENLRHIRHADESEISESRGEDDAGVASASSAGGSGGFSLLNLNLNLNLNGWLVNQGVRAAIVVIACGAVFLGNRREEAGRRYQRRRSGREAQLFRSRLPSPLPEFTGGEATAMATRYWIISLPVQGGTTAGSLWSRLQDSISRHSFDTPLYRFNVPDLRVGTLDSLLALSDDLVKSNVFVEGVSHKIRRQIEDLERAGGLETGALTVDGVPIDTYLTRFVWDEGKYPTMSPLKEIVGSIQSQVARIEDDMKVRAAEYNNVRSQLSAINRKQSGSLAVRDLSNLVKPEDMVTSEHLVTLLAIVPKYSQKDWLASYESLDTFVVPRSSKKLYEDNEYALYTVTLFAKVVDNFKVRARERGFQVRDFEYSPEAQESRKQEMEKLLQDQETMRASLLQWCYASYSEVFSSWMHFCAVRVFVESILRYGLPPSFLSAVLAPPTKSEKKVRSILEELCGNVHSIYWKSEDDVGVAGLGGETEAHPYVSFTINFV